MVEIETTQQILVGLAFAAVGGHDESGHGFEQLAGAKCRDFQKFLLQDEALAGSLGDAQQL